MAQLTESAAVRRLHDRLGFGLGGSELAASHAGGFDAAVGRLLGADGRDAGAAATPPPDVPFRPRPAKVDGVKPDQSERKAWRREMRAQLGALSLWWLDRMVAAEQPTVERLTWFWHGHFATSAKKVKVARLMLAQNETFRRHALGSFAPLAQAMIIDPAMLVWLDGNDNTAKAPNENLSREFLELFTLGHGAYSEADVREAARALTGWKINRQSGQAALRPRQHDDGPKRILGDHGRLHRRLPRHPAAGPAGCGRIRGPAALVPAGLGHAAGGGGARTAGRGVRERAGHPGGAHGIDSRGGLPRRDVEPGQAARGVGGRADAGPRRTPERAGGAGRRRSWLRPCAASVSCRSYRPASAAGRPAARG